MYFVPAILILISSFVFIVFGFLGFCGMNDCLGSGTPSIEQKLSGAAYVFAASLPLVASATVILADWRKKRLGYVARTFVWTIVIVAGGLGVFQVMVDPGDAFWAGAPLIVFSAILVICMLDASHR